MDVAAVWLTVRLASVTTIALAVVGIPLAYWLATTRSPWRPIVDALVALPLLLPPTVLGFYLLMGMGPGTPLGRGWAALAASTLPFSFTGIAVASVIYNLPFAVRPFAAGFAGVDRRLVDAARCLGASPLRTFMRVTVPLSWPGLLAGAVLAFAHTVGEFGVVLMVGGNIPGVTRTIALSIYDDVQALNYGAAGEASFVLVLFAFTVLTLMYWAQRKVLPI